MKSPPTPAVALAAEQVRELIARRMHLPGSRLPGERLLAEQIGVSRATVRLGLKHLEADGLLYHHPQRGWFIVGSDTVSDRASELFSFTELARNRGFEPTADVLRFERAQATLEESEMLAIAPAAPVVRLSRVRRIDSIPLCLHNSVIVGSGTEALLERDFRTASLYEVLAQDCGITVYRSSCTLQARAATAEQGELLQLSVGAPVLECIERSSTSEGRIVLTSHLVYRGDSYKFQADLYRNNGPTIGAVV